MIISKKLLFLVCIVLTCNASAMMDDEKMMQILSPGFSPASSKIDNYWNDFEKYYSKIIKEEIDSFDEVGKMECNLPQECLDCKGLAGKVLYNVGYNSEDSSCVSYDPPKFGLNIIKFPIRFKNTGKEEETRWVIDLYSFLNSTENQLGEKIKNSEIKERSLQAREKALNEREKLLNQQALDKEKKFSQEKMQQENDIKKGTEILQQQKKELEAREEILQNDIKKAFWRLYILGTGCFLAGGLLCYYSHEKIDAVVSYLSSFWRKN